MERDPKAIRRDEPTAASGTDRPRTETRPVESAQSAQSERPGTEDLAAARSGDTRGKDRPPSAQPIDGEDDPLLETKEAEAFRTNWRAIQTDFVDHPKESVRAADSLVAEVMQTLAASFAEHKGELESQWSRGQEAATEDLRIALQRYRSFFNRLLST